MIVKICGLTRAEDAALADEYGANVCGFIYGIPVSPRNNSLEKLSTLMVDRGQSHNAVLMRNPQISNIAEIFEMVRPHILHLCGQESSELRDAIKNRWPELKIWQTIGIPIDRIDDEQWKYQCDSGFEEQSLDQIVLDSAKSGQSGGTGSTFPHQIVADHLGRETSKVVIAGGLDPDNIEAILNIAAWAGVDVSSGVEESKGCKDPDKMNQFMQNIRKAQS